MASAADKRNKHKQKKAKQRKARRASGASGGGAVKAAPVKRTLDAGTREVLETEQRWLTEQGLIAGLGKFFVAGAPHCGAAWLSGLLASHPQLVSGTRAEVGGDLIASVRALLDEHDQDAREQGRQSRIPSADQLFIVRTMLNVQFAHLYQAEPKRGVQALGDTLAADEGVLRGIHWALPEARIVHVVREGRQALAQAWAAEGVQSGRPVAAFADDFLRHSWCEPVRDLRGLGKQLGERYLEVRYEDLCDPEQRLECMQRVCGFLEVSASQTAVSSLLEQVTTPGPVAPLPQADLDHCFAGNVGELMAEWSAA